MSLKKIANNYFVAKRYNEAIKIYSLIIYKNNRLLFNRHLAYIKMNDYINALKDAQLLINIFPHSSKAWGRLGATLYKLNCFDVSLIAYKKAYKLENKFIYFN